MRLDRKKLNIGTYCLQPYARTEEHIRDMAACGIDFVIGLDYDKETLDLFSRYGIGAVVSGIVPGWFGGMGENAGQMEKINPLEKYDNIRDSFSDHPAIWGVDVGDEPSALDFPHYGKIIDRVNCSFPNQFAYLNLYPNYGMLATNTAEEIKRQLGTETYNQYIEQYCHCVNTDYICCDFYPYSSNVKEFYNNFLVVAKACNEYDRHFWMVLQVNSHREDVSVSLNQLRFQAYTAMAFGAEVITWACYTAGWWYHQVLDAHGNKTEQYNKLQCVNREIKLLAERYMRYRNIATFFVGEFDPLGLHAVPLEAFHSEVFCDLKDENNLPLVIGQMCSREALDDHALMICPADDPMDVAQRSYRLCFKVTGARKIHAWDGCGELPVSQDRDGYYRLNILSNQGVFIEAE